MSLQGSNKLNYVIRLSIGKPLSRHTEAPRLRVLRRNNETLLWWRLNRERKIHAANTTHVANLQIVIPARF
jgi:hypothetical protein